MNVKLAYREERTYTHLMARTHLPKRTHLSTRTNNCRHTHIYFNERAISFSKKSFSLSDYMKSNT